MRRLAILLALGTAISLACAPPLVVEDTAAACANDVDDDGDGLIDCADPDCAATDACEVVLATCSNGIDDDRDGKTDCEQESCRRAGFCEPFEAACDVAAQSGCPPGMGCFVVSDGKLWCATGGAGLEGYACGPSADGPYDPAEGCAPGYLCTAPNGCLKACGADADCPRSSLCLIAGEGVGFCSQSCAPGGACSGGLSCVALQRQGISLATGGWMHMCLQSDGVRPPGRAPIGAACNGDAFVASPDETCVPGSLCVPEPGGAVCRETCVAPLDGGVARTCSRGLCYAVVPFDPRPPRTGDLFTIGVCLP
jgi:hypothetical protein